jgi:hypothetical protein
MFQRNYLYKIRTFLMLDSEGKFVFISFYNINLTVFDDLK